ncbi:MAG: hypothetical protein RI894_1076 [Bacteroidota bacterium]
MTINVLKIFDFIKRYFLWIIAILLTVKLAWKQVFPPPRLSLHTIKQEYSNEEEWLTSSQLAILPHNNYRYKREYETDTLLLLRHQRYLFFSTKNGQDQFSLEIRGRDLLNSLATFKIIQPNGSVIYTMSAPTIRALCASTITDPAEQEDAVHAEIAHFFDAQNFLMPALQDEERYDATVHLRDTATFNELFYHNDYNGFMYHSFLNHDERIKIAYSRILKRIVVYYRCCRLGNLAN